MRQSAAWRIAAVLLSGGLAAALLAACPNGEPVQPQILTFNYKIRQLHVRDVTDLLNRIRSGQTTVANELGSNPCNFTASFANPTPPMVPTAPIVHVGGGPGAGFNLNITTTTPVSITTTNPPTCQSVDEIAISIGGAQTGGLDVGGRTNLTSAELVVGGTRFTSAVGFFEATLTNFQRPPPGGYASGQFRFVATTQVGNATLLGDGSYALQ
jgi:hypothetical protein